MNVCIDDTMRPSWGHDYALAGLSLNSETSSGIIARALLCIDDGAALPYFKELGRRPTGMRGDCVNMSLAANGLSSKSSVGVGDHAKEQVTPLQLVFVSDHSNIHADSIDRVRAMARGIKQALSYCVKPTHLRLGTEHIVTKAKAE